jgi:hypothetical protein
MQTETQRWADVIRLSGKLSFRHPRPELGISPQYLARDQEAARRFFPEFGLTYCEDVVEKIGRLQGARGDRLLLLLESFGGTVAGGNEILRALRRFREEGGHVTAYVAMAISCAAPIAVEADAVLIHPNGFFDVHSPLMLYGAQLREDRRTAIVERDAEQFERRTATPRETLEAWLALQGDRATSRVTRIDARTAVAHGWADSVAAFPGEAPLGATRRSAWLETRDRSLFPLEKLPTVAPHEEPRISPEWSAFHFDSDPDAAQAEVGYNHPLPGSSLGAVQQTVDALPHEMAARQWAERSSPSGTFLAVARGGFTFAAVGSSIAASSPDGVTWTQRTIQGGSHQDVVWTGSQFVAVGLNVCSTSPDGVTWTSRTFPFHWYYSLAQGAGLLVAIGPGVDTVGYCATSSDGITWTERTIPTGDYRRVTYGAGKFVAVGPNACATSPDGITWTARTIGANHHAVAYGAGARLFAAVGTPGTLSTSPDGITWTARTMPSVPGGTAFQAIAWSGAIFCALDGDTNPPGVAMTSPNGIDWKAQTSGLPHVAYQSVAWCGDQFFAASSSGKIVASWQVPV